MPFLFSHLLFVTPCCCRALLALAPCYCCALLLSRLVVIMFCLLLHALLLHLVGLTPYSCDLLFFTIMPCYCHTLLFSYAHLATCALLLSHLATLLLLHCHCALLLAIFKYLFPSPPRPLNCCFIALLFVFMPYYSTLSIGTPSSLSYASGGA